MERADFSQFYRVVHPLLWPVLWLSIRAARLAEVRLYAAGYVHCFWDVTPLGHVHLRAAYKQDTPQPRWTHDGPRAHELADLDWQSAMIEKQDKPGVIAFISNVCASVQTPPDYALLDPG